MFKTLEQKWNSKTPKFLHNRTKENFIFQISLAMLFLLGLVAKDRWEDRKFRRSLDDKNYLTVV